MSHHHSKGKINLWFIKISKELLVFSFHLQKTSLHQEKIFSPSE
jgi:hypothetical protein